MNRERRFKRAGQIMACLMFFTLLTGCSNEKESLNIDNYLTDEIDESEKETTKDSHKGSSIFDSIHAGNNSDKNNNEKNTEDKGNKDEESTTDNSISDDDNERETETEVETESSGDSITLNNPSNPDMIIDELHQEYIEHLAPADDDVDFMFANDYNNFHMIKFLQGSDACSYGEILGIDKKITASDIEEVLKTNNNISKEYKDFILQYVKDWLALYPETDFRVLYHNLKTLEIDIVSESEMMMETLSTDSAACYLKKENRILLLDGQDFSRETDNYIILTHELTHCARQTSYTGEDGVERRIYYYADILMGLYAEEGIITNIAYELQGLSDRANFYPFQSSCYRIIMDCIGYDAEDFMNHSVNYLIKRMDEFMGDEQYAYYIVALIDAISTERYTSYIDVDFTNYQDLYDYMTRMYMKKYLSADMSTEEAEKVFGDFCDNIMYNFDQMNRKYDISEDNFRPAFEQCVKELGIS